MTRTKSTLKGKRCQCTACKEFFSSSSSFDKHRKWSGEDRVCIDPEDAGLSISERAGNTFWTSKNPMYS